MSLRTARVLFLVALGLPLAEAAPPAVLYVSSPQPRLISGTQVQLSATARDSSGAVTDGSFGWTSSNPGVLSVDSRGMVTAGAPGIADVFASVGPLRGAVRLQVLPSKIVVSPASKQVRVGDSIQFAAAAVDTNGNAISGVAFQWQLVGANANFTAAAVIDRNGLFSATATGRITVRAMIVYPFTPGGFVNQFMGEAQVVIQPPAEYRLTRLLSTSDTRNSFQLRPRRNVIAANDAGQVATVAALDGLSDGLMLFDNGRLNLLASAGTPAAVPATLIWDFGDPAVNNAGQVLARVDELGTGSGLMLASRDGASFIMLDGESAGGIGEMHGFTTTRYSLNDNGQVLFRATYRVPGGKDMLTGMFVYSNGSLQLAWSSDGALPGLTGAITFEQDFGLDANGVVYFRVFNGTTRAIYRQDGFSAPAKVIGTGDRLADSTLRNLYSLAVAAGGDLVFAGDLATGRQFLARYPGGDVTKPPQITFVSYVRSLYGANSAGGVVFVGDAGRGYGLYRWRNDAVDLLLARGRPAPNGAPVADFDGASITSQGEVYAQVHTPDTPLVVLRLGSPNRLLFQSGDRLDIASDLVFRALVPGAHAGPAHLLMGGGQSSIFEVDPRGPIPRLVVGDHLPGGLTFPGVYPVRKSPSGDLFTATDDALYRLSAGNVQNLMAFPARTEDGVVMFSPFLFAVNDSGGIVWSSGTNDSHQRVVVPGKGRLNVIAYLGTNPKWQTASPGGGTFAGLNEMAMDESRRIMAFFRVNGGPSGYFLYDGSSWQPTALMDNTSIGGVTVNAARDIKAAGQNFYANFNENGGGSVLAVFGDQGWTPVVARGDTAPNGNLVNGIAAFDVNRQGDVALSLNANGENLLVLLADGAMRLIQMTDEPATGDDYFRYYDVIDLRDDRRLYFTGMDLNDEYLLYVAEPLF